MYHVGCAILKSTKLSLSAVNSLLKCQNEGQCINIYIFSQMHWNTKCPRVSTWIIVSWHGRTSICTDFQKYKHILQRKFNTEFSRIWLHKQAHFSLLKSFCPYLVVTLIHGIHRSMWNNYTCGEVFLTNEMYLNALNSIIYEYVIDYSSETR